jgi:hypothetical protein
MSRISLPSLPPLGFALPRGPRLRRPRPPRLRLPPRPPLPLTATAVALLLALPLGALLRWPRPEAEGLEKLLSAATLLQSFAPSPDRPVPALWQERLPAPLATSLWRGQRRTWWQFWGVHSDVPPYLALPATGPLSAPNTSLPANALRVDDLVVLAPDALSLRLLQDRLLPRQRRSRGLPGRCAERLRRAQAVFWDPTALAVIVGPLAPLLQEFQEGCLVLDLDPLGLRWQGEAASVEGVLLPLAIAPRLADVPLQPPLPADRLLEVEGDSLAPLMRGLLSRQLIRDPLGRNYEIDAQRQELLRRSPFLLRLRPLAQGPFQAGLELELEPGSDRAAWQSLLTDLASSLRRQKLKPVAPRPAAVVPPSPSPTLAVNWQREDGTVVGGWRWLQSAEGQARVLFFLGPPPPPAAPMGRETLRPGRGEMRLRARPAALETLGILPPLLPSIVRRSEQLWIEAAPPPGIDPAQPVSRLTGRLQVRR